MDFLIYMFTHSRITLEQLQVLIDKGTITQEQYDIILLSGGMS